MKTEYDFVSVGGGAAGYFGAIAFAESYPGGRVAILERSSAVLSKVKISGGGRCNVTHACEDPRLLSTRYPRGERTMIGPFHRWGTAETVDWFESRGVALKTEADGRMFPVTDDSQTIIQCLKTAADESGVTLLKKAEVQKLSAVESGWEVRLKDGNCLQSRAVLLATGGVRSPLGAELARGVGHSIVPAAPSLFTFKIEDPRIKDLAGLSVSETKIRIEGLSLRSEGPCLITHWGLSGPGILKLSSWGARDLAEREYQFEIVVNWCGEETRESVSVAMQQARHDHPKRRVRSGLSMIAMPSRLWQRLVEAAEIDEETTWSNLSRAERQRLVAQLVECRFRVTGKSTNKDEFVTAGGVSLKEVNFKTLESKIAPGLYFAGEVLDIDGITGGYNFQSAWTTGKIAGESAAEALAMAAV